MQWKEKNNALFEIDSQGSITDAYGTNELDTSLDLQADLEVYRLQVQQDMGDVLKLMQISLPMHLALAVIGAGLFWTSVLRCDPFDFAELYAQALTCQTGRVKQYSLVEHTSWPSRSRKHVTRAAI